MRTRLQASGTERDFALFNPAIDSKLRGCDLVITTVGDVAHSGSVLDGTVIVQNKTGRPVPFKITEQGRAGRSRVEGIHDLSRRKSNTAREYADREGRPIHEAD